MKDFKPDYTKPAKHILIDMINYANRTGMTTLLHPDTTFFTKPVKTPEGSDMNTEIRFAKVKGYKVPRGTEALFYNRLDITQMAFFRPWDFVIYVDGNKVYKTTHDLLDDVFDVFPVKLTKEDVIEEVVNFELGDPDSIWCDEDLEGQAKGLVKNKVTFNISPDSIGYYGQLTFRVYARPIDIRIPIKQTKLKGFTYVTTLSTEDPDLLPQGESYINYDDLYKQRADKDVVLREDEDKPSQTDLPVKGSKKENEDLNWQNSIKLKLLNRIIEQHNEILKDETNHEARIMLIKRIEGFVIERDQLLELLDQPE